LGERGGYQLRLYQGTISLLDGLPEGSIAWKVAFSGIAEPGNQTVAYHDAKLTPQRDRPEGKKAKCLEMKVDSNRSIH